MDNNNVPKMKGENSEPVHISDEIRSLFETASSHEKNGNYQAALDCYDTITLQSPSNTLAYYKRGWIYANMGQIKEELNEWNKAIDIDIKYADALASRALIKFGLKDSKGAFEDATAAITINPELRKLLNSMLKEAKKQIGETAIKTEDDGLHNEKFGAIPENKRRNFLKQITSVGLATVAISATGCGGLGKSSSKNKWGMVIDLERCVACKACVVSCKNENKTPPGVAYNVFIEEEHGEYPHTSATYFTRPCMHCEKSSCSKVCPVKATYHREDGIVVVDYDKCIGCRYCIASCPYGARSFDYGHNYITVEDNPYNSIPSNEYNGKFGLRENGKSPIGNVRKCMFCLHLQDEKGDYRKAPACATTCMGKAIHFGNMNDPDAKCIVHGENMRELIARRNHHRLKEELGNEPNVYYLT